MVTAPTSVHAHHLVSQAVFLQLAAMPAAPPPPPHCAPLLGTGFCSLHTPGTPWPPEGLPWGYPPERPRADSIVWCYIECLSSVQGCDSSLQVPPDTSESYISGGRISPSAAHTVAWSKGIWDGWFQLQGSGKETLIEHL